MQYMHSYFQILKFPLIVIAFACFLCGVSNIILHPAYGLVTIIANDGVFLVGELLGIIARTILMYAPLLILLRLLTQKKNSSVTVGAGIIGYFAFHAATMFVPAPVLPSYAYNALFNIGITSSTVSYLSGSANYPLLTGMVGTIIVTMLTYIACRTGSHHGIGQASLLKQTDALLKTVIYCILAGAVFGVIWPYFILFIVRLVNYISSDLGSPFNMILYGITDRFLQLFHLNALIRQPLWYSPSGGLWTNIAGATVVGDANVWTAQLGAGTLTSGAGRLFAPYYVMNIFAIPAMIWGMYSIGTSKVQRAKVQKLCIVGTLISMISGTTISLQIMMFMVSPLLFFFHLGYNGFLYGLFSTLHVNLGYLTIDTNTVTAIPGTLPELLSYLKYTSLYRNLIIVVIVGVISAIVYFSATRLYFRHLSTGLIIRDEGEKMVKQIIKYIGGQENIKHVDANATSLMITVYDKEIVHERELMDLGSISITRDENVYTLLYGAKSYFLHKGIINSLRTVV